MKLKLFIIIVGGCALLSCQKNRLDNIERTSLTPKMVTDMETMMPGGLLVTDNYLIWTDPFNVDGTLVIIDKKTGQEIARTLSLGSGPDELVSVNISPLSGDRFLAYDHTANKYFEISIVSGAVEQERVVLNEIDKREFITRIVCVEDNMVTFSPFKEPPFVLEDKNGNSFAFGEFPIKDIEDGFDYFQGEVVYNPQRKILAYTIYSFPYIALYQLDKNKLIDTKSFCSIGNYDIVDGELKYDRSVRGACELALTSNFIVTLERDYQSDPTDEDTVGRDFSKLPQTVFLYDYDLNLRKIVNVGMPVLRLAADPYHNTVYAIGINPDFTIVKFDI